uniref:Secreted protein n=1 Tax=Heterorhabditis bacteriophora TaxID=37862 RepID=A0A1I7XE90_HETBA
MPCALLWSAFSDKCILSSNLVTIEIVQSERLTVYYVIPFYFDHALSLPYYINRFCC